MYFHIGFTPLIWAKITCLHTLFFFFFFLTRGASLPALWPAKKPLKSHFWPLFVHYKPADLQTESMFLSASGMWLLIVCSDHKRPSQNPHLPINQGRVFLRNAEHGPCWSPRWQQPCSMCCRPLQVAILLQTQRGICFKPALILFPAPSRSPAEQSCPGCGVLVFLRNGEQLKQVDTELPMMGTSEMERAESEALDLGITCTRHTEDDCGWRMFTRHFIFLTLVWKLVALMICWVGYSFQSKQIIPHSSVTHCYSFHYKL